MAPTSPLPGVAESRRSRALGGYSQFTIGSYFLPPVLRGRWHLDLQSATGRSCRTRASPYVYIISLRDTLVNYIETNVLYIPGAQGHKELGGNLKPLTISLTGLLNPSTLNCGHPAPGVQVSEAHKGFRR